LAAVLGASRNMLADGGGRNPVFGVAAGDDVALDAHVGDIEIVQYVLAGHDQVDGFVHGHVQFVDGAGAVGEFELPQPLFGGDLDFQGFAGADGERHAADDAPA